MYYPHYFPDRATMLKTAATQEESLLKQLESFAADFGADKFENFRERMDRLFGPRKNGTASEGQATQADLQSAVQSNVQSNVEAQSQLRTESESRGCPRDSIPT